IGSRRPARRLATNTGQGRALVAGAVMTIAAAITEWVSLADVLRYALAQSRAPEADTRSDIVDAIYSGKLPHQVDRVIRYLPRPPSASLSEPPPMEVTRNGKIPWEVLERGIAGRGSAHWDWHNGRLTRRAGATWQRIECEGIRCSRQHM